MDGCRTNRHKVRGHFENKHEAIVFLRTMKQVRPSVPGDLCGCQTA